MNAPGTSALDRLERLLLLLPRAQRAEGVSFRELEALLGVDRRVLQGDLELLTSRAAYLRAGDPADLQVTLEPDRIHIFSPGPFRRPPRLGAREALALVLGVRTRALLRGPSEDPDGAVSTLLRRLEGALARQALEQLEPLPVEDASARSADARFRGRALDAIAERIPLSILYLKPGDDAPRRRTLHPLTVVHAEWRWYLLGVLPAGRPEAREADTDEPSPQVRAFRFDRILELDLDEAGAPFPEPEDFDPREHLDETRVFSAARAETVEVDYSPRIARWIAERFEGEERPDGGLRVRHRVADREWLVRHVLQYGGEAVAHPPGRVWVLEALHRNRFGTRGTSDP